MKRLLPLLACMLLPACTLFEERPPIHAYASRYHYEPLREEEEASLRRAFTDYAAIRLHRVWYHAVDSDEDEWSRTLARGEETEAMLAPLIAARRWYEEHLNGNCIVMPNWGIISTITFLDAEGRELISLSSTNAPSRRGKDGKAIDLFENFESAFPEDPR